ncbi:MAG: SUF system NifU family Fe-S cluster assembly protein [Candidatus Beckwithbacteria bacterium]|nr:SUF system NifU family Fe-S cluster assembly protein [Candidatus Beckwithbacteria bacterium]
MDLYREEILDHYKHPRNFGPLDGFDIKEADRNSSCGDSLEMGVKIKDGKIVDVKFTGVGCAISMASASMLTEMLKGKTIKQAAKIDDQAMLKRLGIPISLTRQKCATLGVAIWQKLTQK